MRPTVILTVTYGGQTAVLDLYENESISFSNAFTDITEFKARGGFSREFRIPATKTNVEFFGAQHKVGLFSTIDIKKKIDAVLTVDTLPIAEGHIQFKRSITQHGKLFEYEIAFFSEVVDAARSIGDKMISELDYSSLAHSSTWDNVVDANDGIILGGNVCYTLTDRGQNWTESNATGSRRIFSSVNPIYTNELTVAVKTKWLLDKIFSEAGFTWSGTTIEAELENMWYPFIKSNLTLGNVTADASRFRADFAANTNFTIDQLQADGSYIKQLTGFTETFDPSNSFATDTYTANGNFTVNFGINFEVTVNTTGFATWQPHNYDFYLQLTRSGVDYIINLPYGQNISTVNYEYDQSGQVYQTVITNPFIVNISTTNLNLEVGDQLKVFVRAHQGSSQAITISADSSIGISYVSGELQAQPVSFSNNSPEQKQIEFVNDILKLFNAVIVPDTTIPNSVNIIPIVEFIASGTDYDWTTKLDEDKDILLRPATDLQRRFLRWSYKEQSDRLNAYYKNGAQRVYGELRLNNPESDFAVGDYKVELTFGPTPCNAIPNTTYVIPKFINDSGQFVNPGPRILYRRPYAESASVQVYNEATNASQLTVIPLLNHYKNVPTDVSTDDLNFGQEIPLFQIDAMPLRTMWDKYWREYIAEIYDSEQRIMEAYFALGVTDVFNLKFNDKIFVKDGLWRVLEVSDYVIGDQISTKVTLIRLLDLGALCTYTPYQINATSGAVTFLDQAGGTSVGNQTCCEYYGYTWDTSKNKCYATLPFLTDKPILSSPGSIGESNLVIANGTQKSATGLGTVAGGDIELGNERLLTNGSGHAIAPNNRNSVVSGSDNMLKTNLPSSAVFGKNAFGELRGVHFGGGSWWDITSDTAAPVPGRTQHGFITLMGEAPLTGTVDIDVTIDGAEALFINMPTETTWLVKAYVSFVEYDYGVGDFTGVVAGGEWNGLFFKDKTTHTVSKMIMQARHGNVLPPGDIDCNVAVVGGEIVPTVTIKRTSGYTGLVSVVLQYTQTKFQRTPIL